ncbi:MAG: co-chaperone GroES [Armatimonadia bacterium]|nr:co-chaperone GroES [Armatimonadia bacterium]
MLKPLGDRVIVEISAAEEVTAGGIVLPDSAQEKPQKGTIVAVGEGKILEDGSRGPMEVEIGNTVIFSKYGGTEVRDGDKDLVILRQDDIYAIETEGKKSKKK